MASVVQNRWTNSHTDEVSITNIQGVTVLPLLFHIFTFSHFTTSHLHLSHFLVTSYILRYSITFYGTTYILLSHWTIT
ncbi:hypothetical protein BD769DRAFT_1542996 [Suillus cothurnatus]|nr:hypothetical protein BD769DRAFT_1542996 [Suillus cothurnatus]